jgi:hypothetical protein
LENSDYERDPNPKLQTAANINNQTNTLNACVYQVTKGHVLLLWKMEETEVLGFSGLLIALVRATAASMLLSNGVPQHLVLRGTQAFHHFFDQDADRSVAPIHFPVRRRLALDS